MPWKTKQERNEYQRRYRRDVLGMRPRPIVEKSPCARAGCESPVPRAGQRYCGAECYEQDQYESFIRSWLAGEINPSDYLGRVSLRIKRWFIEQFGERCQQCGWAERNPSTGKVPLHFEHVDGDCANNARGNLRLLCPNCHALTPTYAALNYGNSKRRRKWAGTVVLVPMRTV